MVVNNVNIVVAILVKLIELVALQFLSNIEGRDTFLASSSRDGYALAAWEVLFLLLWKALSQVRGEGYSCKSYKMFLWAAQAECLSSRVP